MVTRGEGAGSCDAGGSAVWSSALPKLSRLWTVAAAGEQVPAVTVCGLEVKTRWFGDAAPMVSAWVGGVGGADSAVVGGAVAEAVGMDREAAVVVAAVCVEGAAGPPQ